MNKVFLDTVGLLALWNEDDQWHTAADTAFQMLMQNRTSIKLYCTTYVLLECGNAMSRWPDRWPVLGMIPQLKDSDGLIVPTELDWERAWYAYDCHEGANAGIVDCFSFVVMRRLGIQQVFTNDEHFRAAGFEILF